MPINIFLLLDQTFWEIFCAKDQSYIGMVLSSKQKLYLQEENRFVEWFELLSHWMVLFEKCNSIQRRLPYPKVSFSIQ